MNRDDILRSLVKIQYNRNDVAFERGTFRVRGDTVEIFPAYEEQGVRVEMWGDEIERISKINVLTGETIAALERAAIYPAKHFVTQRPTLERAVKLIREELVERLAELRNAGQAARGAAARAPHELRHRDDARDRDVRRHRELLATSLRAREPASGRRVCSTTSPRTSSSSSTSRTSRCRRSAGMFNGDRARKLTLVDYGFRLPSALDNRPLMFDEFLVAHAARRVRLGDAGETSSCGCPRAWSSSRSFGRRGWSIPRSRCGPVRGQVDDLLNEIRKRASEAASACSSRRSRSGWRRT